MRLDLPKWVADAMSRIAHENGVSRVALIQHWLVMAIGQNEKPDKDDPKAYVWVRVRRTNQEVDKSKRRKRPLTGI